MVDINLFEDEEQEEKSKPQDFSSKEEEKKPSPLLSEEDFGFGEELGESDLEQLGPDLFQEETPSGVSGKKKASPPRKAQKSVSWSFIFVMALIVGGFILFLQYGMKYLTYSPPKPSPSKPVKPSPRGPVTTRPMIGVSKDSVSRSVPPGGTKVVAGTYLDATKAIVENLCKNGQFSGVLLKNDQFYVEYASDVKGVSQAIGKQVQALLNVSEFKASPEERQRLAKGVRYFGVISGKFQPGLPNVTLGEPGPGTVDQFIEKLNALLAQNRISSKKVQKLPSYTDKGTLKTPVNLLAEGDRQNIMAFLEGLKFFSGNYQVSKVHLVPAEAEDFQANRMKIVFDFVVSG